MLDADAEPSLDNAQVEDIVRIYRNERAFISFLPFTPEVGLIHFLVAHRVAVLTKLRQLFMMNTLAMRAVDLGQPPAPGTANERDLCKAIVNGICELLSAQLPNTSEADVRNTLFRLLAEHVFVENRPQVMRLFGPVVRG
jgi:hypothetical protein